MDKEKKNLVEDTEEVETEEVETTDTDTEQAPQEGVRRNQRGRRAVVIEVAVVKVVRVVVSVVPQRVAQKNLKNASSRLTALVKQQKVAVAYALLP